ncbi:MAG TPA: hypothetical protein DDW76_27925, partial [Cyanobacteria bacterium UBA11369]|nr:hypothetical protein [Cyanobacteria bacterium UBA11369]
MKAAYKNFSPEFVYNDINSPAIATAFDVDVLANLLTKELQAEIGLDSATIEAVATRIAKEVDRICAASPRIQKSGCIGSWQLGLARHRIAKCLKYYQLGAKQARIELHSTLGAMVYRYMTPMRSPSSFQGRYHMLEDFLQNFYIESLSAFRRENQTAVNYTPRTQLQIAEYLTFTEQYARRRIGLCSGGSQQL